MGGRTRTLYIFPHAGGSAQDYRSFAKAFTSDVRCVAVQYPGLNGVHDLAEFTSISELADRVVATMPPSGGPPVFFGHSMGGLLAFEVALRLQGMGNPVETLFVSACPAPGLSGDDYISRSDRDLLGVVGELTGATRELLEDDEFASRILPTLRGFKAIVDYRCPPNMTVDAPIVALYGDTDDIATPDKVSQWARRTTSGFTMQEFPGHHFYFLDRLADVVAAIEAKIVDEVGIGERAR